MSTTQHKSTQPIQSHSMWHVRIRVFTAYLSFYDATFPYLFYRTIIQVLISGCGRTEVVTVHLYSPGKTLYRAIQERRERLVALVHGVNIVRYRVSLQEQGLHNLSTVFVLPVMGEGGGRTQLGKHFGAGKREKGGRGEGRREGGREGGKKQGNRGGEAEGKSGASGWSLGRGHTITSRPAPIIPLNLPIFLF